MFGISFTELLLVALVVMLVVGPRRLPAMLRQIGEWISKLRRMTSEVREQTGIDDVLRDEGLPGGLSELRRMVRGDFTSMDQPMVVNSPYETVDIDHSREYPAEGPDAYGVLPDDLVPAVPGVAADAAPQPPTEPMPEPQRERGPEPALELELEPELEPDENAAKWPEGASPSQLAAHRLPGTVPRGIPRPSPRPPSRSTPPASPAAPPPRRAKRTAAPGVGVEPATKTNEETPAPAPTDDPTAGSDT